MNIHEANKNIGRLMAEALGLVTENDRKIPRSARKPHAPDLRGASNVGVSRPPRPDAPTKKVGQFTTTALTPEQEKEMKAQSIANARARTKRLERERAARETRAARYLPKGNSNGNDSDENSN